MACQSASADAAIDAMACNIVRKYRKIQFNRNRIACAKFCSNVWFTTRLISLLGRDFEKLINALLNCFQFGMRLEENMREKE